MPLKALYGKLPRNPLLKVVIVSAAIGAALYLLPFVVAGLIIWWAYSAIKMTGLRYAIAGTAAIVGLLFGIPWTMAFVSPSPLPQAPVVSQEATDVQQDSVATPEPEIVVPVIEKQIVTETEEIPYEKTTVNDSALDKGKTVVKTKGVSGTKALTYEITLTEGVQTDKKLVSETITKAAVAEVTAVGTKEARKQVAPAPKAEPTASCDPNYAGACVPIASDVDCAGGSGNGPAYVRGPVTIVGSDIYDLDRDGDGIGCE